MTTIQARPTTYNGIQMRSRLEARYAAALDRMHLVWEYEPRAFASEDGQYLPDFCVIEGPKPGDITYIEVKPTLDLAGLRAVMAKMAIIHASLPQVNLRIYSDAEGMIFDQTPHHGEFWTVGFFSPTWEGAPR